MTVTRSPALFEPWKPSRDLVDPHQRMGRFASGDGARIKVTEH